MFKVTLIEYRFKKDNSKIFIIRECKRRFNKMEFACLKNNENFI